MESQLGKNVVRKEAKDKVTGAAKYTSDLNDSPMLYAKLLTSTYAHAKIRSVNTSTALAMPGVKAVITARDFYVLCGSLFRDRPPLAYEKVRYFGEPVALVVADEEEKAKAAADKIYIDYEPLPVVNSIPDAVKKKPVLIHEQMMSYTKSITEVYPEKGTNICHHQKIRKGDIKNGFHESEVIVEGRFSLPQSDHAAMETRSVRCMVMPDETVLIKSSSQAPYGIKELISKYFGIPEGRVIVTVPFVGGGFGGKATVQLEVLAVIAAMVTKGKWVQLTNSREEDLVTSPCHLGLMGNLKIGATSTGKITAAEMKFYVDTGAIPLILHQK